MHQGKVYTSGYCCWYANRMFSHVSRPGENGNHCWIGVFRTETCRCKVTQVSHKQTEGTQSSLVSDHGSVKPWANQVSGREDGTRGRSDQPTLPHGHREGCVAGTRTSGHSQRTGHLFSSVNRATTEDHRLHVGSSHDPETEERSSDAQAVEHCVVAERSTITAHGVATAALQYHRPPRGERPTVMKGSERSHREEGVISKTSVKAALTELNLFCWSKRGL